MCGVPGAMRNQLKVFVLHKFYNSSILLFMVLSIRLMMYRDGQRRSTVASSSSLTEEQRRLSPPPPSRDVINSHVTSRDVITSHVTSSRAVTRESVMSRATSTVWFGCWSAEPDYEFWDSRFMDLSGAVEV